MARTVAPTVRILSADDPPDAPDPRVILDFGVGGYLGHTNTGATFEVRASQLAGIASATYAAIVTARDLRIIP